MWSDEKHAVQIKGSAHEQFGIYETDEVGPAPVEMTEDGKTRKLFDSHIRFVPTKLKSFGSDVKGYFIVIPSDKLDFTRGNRRELIELVKKKVALVRRDWKQIIEELKEWKQFGEDMKKEAEAAVI